MQHKTSAREHVKVFEFAAFDSMPSILIYIEVDCEGVIVIETPTEPLRKHGLRPSDVIKKLVKDFDILPCEQDGVCFFVAFCRDEGWRAAGRLFLATASRTDGSAVLHLHEEVYV